MGNSRHHFRKIIQDILKTNHDFSVYGKYWNEFIEEKYIKGEFIENKDLNKAYSNCKILLNDHWEDMVENDFISNRIFDALACKTFIISDKISSIQSLFEGCVVTYDNYDELNEKITYYLTHDDERIQLAEKGYELVKNHTFDNRVSELISVIEKEFSSKFLKQIETNMNNNLGNNNLNLIQFINSDYNRILNENKSMNIEIARLQEKNIHVRTRKKYIMKIAQILEKMFC